MEKVSPDELVSVEQAAVSLGKARKTIYEWLEKNRIRGIEIAGTQFIYKSEIERLNNENRNSA